MRTLTALAITASLLAPIAIAPRALHAAETEGKTTATSAGLAKLLDQAGLDFEQQENDRIKVLYKFTDGRSQLVFLQPMSDIREVPVVEVYSPVMRIEGTLPAALGKRLLEASGKQKIGYFGIEEVEDKPWVFCYHNLPTEGITAKSLAAVLITVAELGDEMEKEQLGAAKDEF